MEQALNCVQVCIVLSASLQKPFCMSQNKECMSVGGGGGGGGVGISLFRIVAGNTFLDLLKLWQLDLVGWHLIFLSCFKIYFLKYWSV